MICQRLVIEDSNSTIEISPYLYGIEEGNKDKTCVRVKWDDSYCGEYDTESTRPYTISEVMQMILDAEKFRVAKTEEIKNEVLADYRNQIETLEAKNKHLQFELDKAQGNIITVEQAIKILNGERNA
jgi:hypothetical protein